MIIPFLGVGLGSCLLYCSGKNTSVFLHAFLYKLFPAIRNKQGLQRALFSPNNESGVSIGIPAGSHTGYGLSPRAISRWPRAGSKQMVKFSPFLRLMTDFLPFHG